MGDIKGEAAKVRKKIASQLAVQMVRCSLIVSCACSSNLLSCDELDSMAENLNSLASVFVVR